MMCFDMIMRGIVSPGQVKSISAAIMSLMARASEAAQALSSFQQKFYITHHIEYSEYLDSYMEH